MVRLRYPVPGSLRLEERVPISVSNRTDLNEPVPNLRKDDYLSLLLRLVFLSTDLTENLNIGSYRRVKSRRGL